MGIFFTSAPLASTLRESLRAAIRTPSPEGAPQLEQTEQMEQMVVEVAENVDREVTGKFSWGRCAFAIVVLLGVFAGGIYTAQIEKLVEWSKVLLHAFELLLGAFVGLLTGEAATRR